MLVVKSEVPKDPLGVRNLDEVSDQHFHPVCTGDSTWAQRIMYLLYVPNVS